MTANLGSFDRLLRLLFGIVLIAAPFLAGDVFGNTALLIYGAIVVGAVLVVTAMFRFCPLYRIFGWKTCQV